MLRRLGTERELLEKTRVKQATFVGHVIRKGKMEAISLTGRIPGRRARGKERSSWME